jgi:threonine/homoserine/homoserine lactone efflux protein
MFGNAGNSTGIIFHAAAAVAGLSALLSYSAFVFHALKYLGAAYLVYLGFCAFRGRGAFSLKRDALKRNYWQVYRDGALVNILNPKMPILFLALLPQFISTTTANPEYQIAIMGSMHAVIAFIVHTHLVYFSNFARSYIMGSGGAKQIIKYLTASLFFAFGLRVAFFDRR